MNLIYIALIVTLGVAAGGYFLVRQYGQSEYNRGHTKCQADGSALATEAGRQANEILSKPIAPGNVDRMLRTNDWMRSEGDL